MTTITIGMRGDEFNREDAFWSLVLEVATGRTILTEVMAHLEDMRAMTFDDDRIRILERSPEARYEISLVSSTQVMRSKHSAKEELLAILQNQFRHRSPVLTPMPPPDPPVIVPVPSSGSVRTPPPIPVPPPLPVTEDIDRPLDPTEIMFSLLELD